MSGEWLTRRSACPQQALSRNSLVSPTVKIAVIDVGFDQNHPDLSIVQSNDLRQRGSPLLALETLDDCFVDPSAHGTAVTGIASAIRDNHEGIVGVACGFPIVAISVDGDLPSSQLAQALDIAVLAGAKVINMSLAAVATGDIIVAIQAAWAKGCVLCAAAGNVGDAKVVFPASCDEVIAVGASDQDDLRKKYRKANDEKLSSNYGEKLDVVAPGILCWTTDERGEAGYNQDGGPTIHCGHYYMCSGDPIGNYTSYFHGTSAACPHVTGLAALLLAIDPDLTNQQVRDIIEGACDRVHPEEYKYYKAAGRPNGDWHWEMGYGRINCYTAAMRAKLLKYEARLAQQGLEP
jgi:subtilisin family serine protease